MIMATGTDFFLKRRVCVLSLVNCPRFMEESYRFDKVERDEGRRFSFLLPGLWFRSLTQHTTTA